MKSIVTIKRLLLFHIILNLGIALLITASSYVHIPLVGFKDKAIYFIHFIVLQFTVFGFQYILSLNKIVFKILFPVLFLGLAFVAFWRYSQDVVISGHLIKIAFETKSDIVMEIISFPLIVYMMITMVFVIVIIKLYQKLSITFSPLLFGIAILSVVSYFVIEHMKYGTLKRRLPYNTYFAVKDYLRQTPNMYLPVNDVVQSNVDSLQIIFVLGESVRADHFNQNGYRRETMPKLFKRREVITFSGAYTNLTYTGISVPQILSNASIDRQSNDPKQSVIDVLNKAGVSTSWIGNQTPEKSYDYFIKQSAFHKIIDPTHNELSFTKAYDETLIDEFIAHNNTYPKQFTVLHMMGSHWFYENRYPSNFQYYKPLAKSKHITTNTSKELINSYDNTIRYLDYVLNKLIETLDSQPQKTIMIYVSDHGEILGEDGKWLHGQEHKASMNPGMLIWCSKAFLQAYPNFINHLKHLKNEQIKLDFVYPTILDLFEVRGITYDKSISLFHKIKSKFNHE